MSAIRRCLMIASGSLITAGAAVALAAPAAALPVPDDFADVPARTSLSFEYTPSGLHLGTANENEPRPGLSTVKLYIADYALNRGDGSTGDRDLAARMIQFSDDSAADRLDSKYPGAIDATAAAYGLSSTTRGDFWGNSYTSTADTVRFLETKKRADPGSPVLGWMVSAGNVAADGTIQDWGTSRLADATGTKWGWADDGSSVVASASIGDGFSVAANTYGPPSTQTQDVLDALGGIDVAPPVDVAPAPGPLDIDQLLATFFPRP